MSKTPSQHVPPSFHKALLAGLAGGLVGSATKTLAEKLVPPRTQGQEPPPKLVVERAASAADVPLEGTAKKVATESLHWGFGTLTGGLYGLAAEYQPRTTAWRGAAFGLAVNRMMHEGLLPRTGLVEPVAEQPAQERVSEWFTHLVYGVSVELVRRAVRKRL
ncbi:DUF1440 domain-containing protein [Acidipila sp. EB88]|uniref:DUF1440 domain-containing protein n=1 Tax=Acidipila sp. EB88 TaxID=2305226 RepID=UPI000F5ED816|nr:DUF1440 domain-containing protein [Acidipila sp. EB88]RRA48815.1 DUF1440 domain-containing protein [Acidipila sp. EB88]